MEPTSEKEAAKERRKGLLAEAGAAPARRYSIATLGSPRRLNERRGSIPAHRSFFGESESQYFPPQPKSIRGNICALSPILGRLPELEALWEQLSLDPAFGAATPVFFGNYLVGIEARATMDWLVSLRNARPTAKTRLVSRCLDLIVLCAPSDLAAALFLGLYPLPAGFDFDAALRADSSPPRRPITEAPTSQVTPLPAGAALMEIVGQEKGESEGAPGTESAARQAERRAKEEIVKGHLWSGEGCEKMHRLGREWAAPADCFGASQVFASYGVEYGDREALLKAMPTEHKEFLRRLPWIVEHDNYVLSYAGVRHHSHLSALHNRSASLLAAPPFAPALFEPLHSGDAAAGRSDSPQSSQQQSASVSVGSGPSLEEGGHSPSEGLAGRKPLYVDPESSVPHISFERAVLNGQGRMAALFLPEGRVVISGDTFVSMHEKA